MNIKHLIILAGLLLVLFLIFGAPALLGLPVIGMALGKDRSRINVRGGGDILIRELKPTPVDAFTNLGIVEKFEIIPDLGMMEIPDAEGNLLDWLSGLKKFGVNITLAQSSKEEIDFVNNAGGKYFDVLYNVPMEDTTTQQFSICLLKIAPGTPLTFAGSTKRPVVLSGMALAPSAAYTRTPTAFNIVKNVPIVIYQNATPAATPTDVAATLYAAIK